VVRSIKRWRLALWGVCLGLALLAAGPHQAGAAQVPSTPLQGTVTRCEPEWAAVPVGEEAGLCIYVQDVVNLYGADFELSFPGMVGVAEIADESPDPGVQILPSESFLTQPWMIFYNTVDNLVGYMHYLVIELNPSTPKTGSGPIACMRFQPVAAGDFSLTFARHDLSTQDGYLIDNTAHACRVTFYNPPAVAVSRFLARPVLSLIRVKWETTQEVGNAGFNLYRSVTRLGPKTKLNAGLIPTRVPPGSIGGARYAWTDSGVVPGQGYFYWLESVSTEGDTILYGPAKARANP
jgi:hypothetical protein